MLDKKASRDGGVSIAADGVTRSPPPVMVLCDVLCGVCIVVIKVTVYLYTVVVCDVTTGRLTIQPAAGASNWRVRANKI